MYAPLMRSMWPNWRGFVFLPNRCFHPRRKTLSPTCTDGESLMGYSPWFAEIELRNCTCLAIRRCCTCLAMLRGCTCLAVSDVRADALHRPDSGTALPSPAVLCVVTGVAVAGGCWRQLLG